MPKYDTNKNRERKRFKAAWVGPEDTDGFVTPGVLYTITEINKSGHYSFINNFGQKDLAHAKYFETIKPPRLGIRR